MESISMFLTVSSCEPIFDRDEDLPSIPPKWCALWAVDGRLLLLEIRRLLLRFGSLGSPPKELGLLDERTALREELPCRDDDVGLLLSESTVYNIQSGRN
jgi:hypothetical protein